MNSITRRKLITTGPIAQARSLVQFTASGSGGEFDHIVDTGATDGSITINFTVGGASTIDIYMGDANLTDAKIQFLLNKYGREFGLAWEALINDDLGAFADIAERFATAAITFSSCSEGWIFELPWPLFQPELLFKIRNRKRDRRLAAGDYIEHADGAARDLRGRSFRRRPFIAAGSGGISSEGDS